MATAGEIQLVASLFDRLTDKEPRQSREVDLSIGDQMREFKDGVARDLTCLLNTRRNGADIPAEFVLTNESLAAYGIPDFGPVSVDREVIRRSIERTVRLFEPRLTRTQVVLDEGGQSKLSFRIFGVLRTTIGMEPVAYDAELPLESRRFRVVGA
jgi:type VI secretion system protein ImpF